MVLLNRIYFCVYFAVYFFVIVSDFSAVCGAGEGMWGEGGGSRGGGLVVL